MDNLPNEIILTIMSFLDDYYSLWCWSRTSEKYYGLSNVYLGDNIEKGVNWMDIFSKRYIPYKIYNPEIGVVRGNSFISSNTRYIVSDVRIEKNRVYLRALRWIGPLVVIKGKNNYYIDTKYSVSYLPLDPRNDKSIISTINDKNILVDEKTSPYLTRGNKLAVKTNHISYRLIRWIITVESITLGETFFSHRKPIPIIFRIPKNNLDDSYMGINSTNTDSIVINQIIMYSNVCGIVLNIDGEGSNCVIEVSSLSRINLKNRIWEDEGQYFLYPYGPYGDKPHLKLKCTGKNWKIMDNSTSKCNNGYIYHQLYIITPRYLSNW